MKVFLLLLHGISAMLLIGGLTHQAIAVWAPIHGPKPGWWNALRAVHPERYAKATVALVVFTATVGAMIYVPFRVAVRAGYLDAQVPWATGLFEIKEHAAAVALALLPAYWCAWREGSPWGRRTFTTLLAALAWWSLVVGLVVNNVRGL